MKTTIQFILFLRRVAKKHPLTEYMMLHGSLNEDRSTSILRQWEKLLKELKLPNTVQILTTCGRDGTKWNKICRQAIVDYTKTMILEEASKLKSTQWLVNVLQPQVTYQPPESFWTQSGCSMMGRQATSTKIRLLTEHSFLATGIVRRHTNPDTACPLCRKAIETVEHFLFECSALIQERDEAQKRHGTELVRNLAADQLICCAEKSQASMIHYMYKARAQKEILTNVYQYQSKC